jgi:hypothetical protein
MKTLKFILGATNRGDPTHFQIHKIRGAYGSYGYRNVPGWAAEDKQLRALLIRVFPKLKSNKTQQAQAGKWTRVIYLFYRVGWTTGEIADKMKVSNSVVCSILRRARNAAIGLRTDGKPRGGKRGRPTKRSAIDF